MSVPKPSPAASPPAAVPAPRPGLRLAVVLLLAAAVGAGAWLALRSRAPSDDPAAVFDYARDRTLAGDGGAFWGLLLPGAREDYAGFLRRMQDTKNPALVEQSAQWRRRVGISREDLARLPPETIFAREHAALAEEMFRGARVFRVDRRGPDEAVLFLNIGNGAERRWRVRRVDRAWRIETLWVVEPERKVK